MRVWKQGANGLVAYMARIVLMAELSRRLLRGRPLLGWTDGVSNELFSYKHLLFFRRLFYY